MASLLLAGATGLVGGHVLDRALADERVSRVVAPTRRPLAAHPKLLNPIVELAQLPVEAEWWSVGGAICALGTTRRKAGSAEAFRIVDHDHPLAVAGLVRARGATRFALNSSMGADARSRFLYTRTKGELENDLERLGFPSLTLVRPGLIGGDREEFRAAERVAGALLRRLDPLLPPRYRISPAAAIAAALVDAAVVGASGRHVVEADRLLG